MIRRACYWAYFDPYTIQPTHKILQFIPLYSILISPSNLRLALPICITRNFFFDKQFEISRLFRFCYITHSFPRSCFNKKFHTPFVLFAPLLLVPLFQIPK